MSLPVGHLARKTIQVDGSAVEIRSLSRKEALGMRSFDDDPDAGENYLIAQATGSSEDEARIFRETTNALEIDKLLDAILELSGLDKLKTKIRAQMQADGTSPNA